MHSLLANSNSGYQRPKKAPLKQEGILHAKLLQEILAGKMGPNGLVKDTQGNEHPLNSHPQLSPLLAIAQVYRSRAVLKYSDWWESQPSTMVYNLKEHSLPTICWQIARDKMTGFLLLRKDNHATLIAYNNGVILAANSNHPLEKLSQLLETSNGAEARLQRASDSYNLPLEVLLLKHLSVDLPQLLNMVNAHNVAMLLRTLDWPLGSASFYQDQRAAHVSPAIDRPVFDLLREGIWGGYQVTLTGLELLVRPLTKIRSPLQLNCDVSELGPLTDGESLLCKHIEQGLSGLKLLQSLKATGDVNYFASLKALYLFTRAGILVSRSSTERLFADSIHTTGLETYLRDQHSLLPVFSIHPPQEMDNQDAELLATLQLQDKLHQEAHRYMNGGDMGAAAQKFEQLAKRVEQPAAALAYLAVTTLLKGGANASKRAHSYAAESLAANPDEPLAWVAQSFTLKAMGEKGAAKQMRASAMDIAKTCGDQELTKAIHALLDLRAILAQKNNKRKSQRSGVTEIGIVAALFVVLFILSNFMGFGENEYFYSGTDPFFYLRRGLLLLGGLLGLKLYTGVAWSKMVKEFNLKPHYPYLALILPYGMFMGWMSPTQRVSSSLGLVLCLTLLHVLSEEIFFRGYLTRVLLDKLDPFPAVFASAALFGLYHLTYYSMWMETAPTVVLYFVGAMTLTVGIPYAWLFYQTEGKKGFGGLWAPIVAHFLVNSWMMWRSVG